MTAPTAWPALPIAEWQATRDTLHLWTQVVGKVRLALSPWQNHTWHTALYVSARGLTTSPMPYGAAGEVCELEFDFLQHQLHLVTSRGETRTVALAPRSVADFHAEVLARLAELEIDAKIWPVPVEVAEPIPFADDHQHASYDPAAAQRFWRVLLQADRVLKTFRGTFLGKSSPVHFFWGAFDLAATRFSGRPAPVWEGQAVNVDPHVMHVGYSHELISAGFWPGQGDADATFYAYAVPEPAGFRQATVQPAGAMYAESLGEWVLPYAAVQAAADPDAALHAFLTSTYTAGADLGGWDRTALEWLPACACGLPARPATTEPDHAPRTTP